MFFSSSLGLWINFEERNKKTKQKTNTSSTLFTSMIHTEPLSSSCGAMDCVAANQQHVVRTVFIKTSKPKPSTPIHHPSIHVNLCLYFITKTRMIATIIIFADNPYLVSHKFITSHEIYISERRNVIGMPWS